MRRGRPRSGGVVLLGLICLLLAWVIYEQVAEIPAIKAMKPSEAAGAGDAATRPAEATSVSMPDRQSLAVILERPLFTQTRRPIGVASNGPQGVSVDFSLSGVVISGGARSALIRSGSDGAVQQVKVGETLGGWTLVEVAADRVVVRRDAVEAEVFLDYAAPAPAGLRTEVPKNTPKEVTNEGEPQVNDASEGKSGEAPNE
jgi:type II secretory pathway component PulC